MDKLTMMASYHLGRPDANTAKEQFPYIDLMSSTRACWNNPIESLASKLHKRMLSEDRGRVQRQKP